MPFTANDPRMDKRTWRRKMKARRKTIGDDERKRASMRIIETIRGDGRYQHASRIALYHPLRHEIDLLDLFYDRKRFCFPRVERREPAEMVFVDCSDRGFADGPFGLKEPLGPAVDKHDIDLFLVPGLAFTAGGDRIGYGRGYYDHYLADIKAPKYGICHAFQIIGDDAWADDGDVSMDKIITPGKVIVCTPH